MSPEEMMARFWLKLDEYQRWLAEFPEITLVLDNLAAEIKGNQSLCASHPPSQTGPWGIRGLREALRARAPVAAPAPPSSNQWVSPNARFPNRGEPVLCAWKCGDSWRYGIAKFTGKRWLDVIPETVNEEYVPPNYWQTLIPPDSQVETKADVHLWHATFECSECKAKHEVSCSQPYFKVLDFECLRCRSITSTAKRFTEKASAYEAPYPCSCADGSCWKQTKAANQFCRAEKTSDEGQS